MSLKIGFIGLPNVGKSTLFRAITKKQVDVENYPFCTIDPNVGTVVVPDNRLEKLAEVSSSEKIVGTTIEFVDIAGLVKEAHKGKGLGNKFLSHIREVDALVQVIRDFEDKDISHVEGGVDPERDRDLIDLELIVADLQTAEKVKDKIEKEVKAGDKEAMFKERALEKAIEALREERRLADIDFSKEEKEAIKELNFLTLKPIIYLRNISSKEVREDSEILEINAKVEDEVAELPPEEARQYLASFGIKESGLSVLIRRCFHALSLISFFTSGEKETKAWTVERGSTAPVAAGKIHSDFQKNFIRAEVISWSELVNLGGWTKARQEGKVKDKGKDYIVKDGDVIFFKTGR